MQAEQLHVGALRRRVATSHTVERFSLQQRKPSSGASVVSCRASYAGKQQRASRTCMYMLSVAPDCRQCSQPTLAHGRVFGIHSSLIADLNRTLKEPSPITECVVRQFKGWYATVVRSTVPEQPATQATSPCCPLDHKPAERTNSRYHTKASCI